MSSINATTFALFGTTVEERHADLIQSVRDRLLTIIGTRNLYPTYGSLARFHPGQISILALRKSIFDALEGDDRIHRTEIDVVGPTVHVRVNSAFSIVIAGRS